MHDKIHDKSSGIRFPTQSPGRSTEDLTLNAGPPNPYLHAQDVPFFAGRGWGQGHVEGQNEWGVELDAFRPDINIDLEEQVVASKMPINEVVKSFAWSNLSVEVKDRTTHAPLLILQSAFGHMEAGELLAIMGPSGSGKTTLLNALAHRKAAAGATTRGEMLINGRPASLKLMRHSSAYVEQEDALTGSLTVRETMIFAVRLGLPRSVSRNEAFRRVDDLLASFGLSGQRHTIVGTPLKKGLSGGQKKRLGVASRLVTGPKILFLDEPTSGLDSALSLEVISYIKNIGRKNNLVMIASIHQPSSTTFASFDKLCLLSLGNTCYFGPVNAAPDYFARIGQPIPEKTNPAEFYLDLINTDLDKNGEIKRRAAHVVNTWVASPHARKLSKEIEQVSSNGSWSWSSKSELQPAAWMVPVVLLHRSWIKSYRDVVAYGIRVVMYLGLAILMGTVFLRLKDDQASIQPFINAIFFGGAFMSFMAVAYVPAFLEDLQTFYQERANGLVGPLSFMVANFIIGMPFLFIIVLVFSVVEYWLTNFRPDSRAFMTWIMWLFLDLLAAESLVVLVTCVLPVFVVALAITAFANGLWMCVDGFLVPMGTLNAFWKYVFHYIDYQAYVFQGMMVNEFKHRTYACARLPDGTPQCSFPSDLQAVGRIRGTAVLDTFSIALDKQWLWVGCTLAIIFAYRVLAYVTLVLRK